ncbi:BlaI/MecI/CopY family transcriptional regulator [Nakamurella sp. PAMC28650]|uniref:BlaI/MecI/CopY family transcriptional regulator n=1 Tax=Nakamurella sp. PAMC28650 TaxID=2762325 RepID=UPI00164D2C86|nr:BlaI/MecI/CopY family transcriptional regulator [Nakamurella sp. PAMC28650]QNK81534.1 BlaI/MecI/CopY family transcriptional regulator [Nakamurella sp. PAMC28650]
MQGLGHLESAVMDVLWAADVDLPVRGVLESMTGRKLAYTTVMTVLDNLHRKGFVERIKQGRAYRYRPTLSRGQAWAAAMQELLAEAGDSEAVLLHFATAMSDGESDVLRSALDRRKRKK